MRDKRHGEDNRQGSCQHEEDLRMYKTMFAYVDKQGDLIKERVRKMAKDKLAQAAYARTDDQQAADFSHVCDPQEPGRAESNDKAPAGLAAAERNDGTESSDVRHGRKSRKGGKGGDGGFSGGGPTDGDYLGKKRPFFRRPWLVGAAASLVLVAVCVGFAAIMNLVGDRSVGNSVAESAQEYALQKDLDQTSPGYGDDGIAQDSSGATNSAAPDASGTTAGAIDESMGKKIIYTAKVTLKVSNVAGTMKDLEAKTVSLGGYIAKSSYSGNDTRASISIKIPQEKFADFKDNLDTFGVVANLTQSSNDVGLQYFDMEARLKNMEAQEKRYLEILQEAKTVEEILKVEKVLGDIRSTIESYKGQLRYWDNQVDYAQVTLNLQQANQDLAVTDPWQPASFSKTLEACKNAVLKTISTVWNLLNYVLVLLAYALPVLIVGGLALGLWVFGKRKKK